MNTRSNSNKACTFQKTFMSNTHSSCKDLRMAGILVADGGRGLTTGGARQINMQ